MKRLMAVVFCAFIIMPGAYAQSLKPESPAPLQEGLNKGDTDTFVGTHYWYFSGGPGKAHVVVSYPPGANFTVTIFDNARSWMDKGRVLIGAPNDHVFDLNLKKSTKCVISIAPVDHALVRQGGHYEIVANGAVAYGAVSKRDPIVQTFNGPGSFGATRFLANGTVMAGGDGSAGTWQMFDPDNRIYKVNIGNVNTTLRYVAGRGLCAMDGGIVFQELK